MLPMPKCLASASTAADRDRGDYRTTRKFRGARAEYGYDWHDRGLHRGWYKDRGDTVIIKRRHRHWDD